MAQAVQVALARLEDGAPAGHDIERHSQTTQQPVKRRGRDRARRRTCRCSAQPNRPSSSSTLLLRMPPLAPSRPADPYRPSHYQLHIPKNASTPSLKRCITCTHRRMIQRGGQRTHNLQCASARAKFQRALSPPCQLFATYRRLHGLGFAAFRASH